VNDLKALRRQGQLARLEKIEAHGDREWVALAWLNERTDQEQFALQREKHDGPKVIVIGGNARVRFHETPDLPAIDVSVVE
jgi:hypothetical protein